MGQQPVQASNRREARTREQHVFAYSLMVIAGWSDAAGFLLFAGLYVSFMSGDSTQLGLKLSMGEGAAAVAFLLVQVAFVFGAGLGRFLRTEGSGSGRRVVLVINVALLGATALLAPVAGRAAGLLAVAAMGLQNALMTQEAGVPIGTITTAALARLGENLADMVRGRRAPALENLAQWVFFVAGALGGGLAFRALHAGSFWLPALASAALIPLAARLPAMKPEPQAEPA